MSSKRPELWPDFDAPEEIEALARAYPSPPPDLEDMACEKFPEAARAWRAARWFKAAAEALMNPKLPEYERQRLGLAVEAVTGRVTAKTPDDKRRAIINIVRRAAAYRPPPTEPSAIDDSPDPSPEEAALTPQQRILGLSLAFFSHRHPIDARLIEEQPLLDAVQVWTAEQGFTSDKRAAGGGKYKLIALAIRKTSFKCKGATDSDGGDYSRLVELARGQRAR